MFAASRLTSPQPSTGAPRAPSKTRYGTAEHPVSFAFISDIDGHPAIDDDAPPRTPLPKVPADRGPRLTKRDIRQVLGKPEPPRENEAQYLTVMRRIERQGF